MKNKNNIYLILIIILIIITIVCMIALKKNKKYGEVIKSESDAQIEQAIKSDTPEAINNSIDSIKVEDTSDADLKVIDDELKNL